MSGKSPHKRDALGSAQNYCVESTCNSSRAALKNELKNKLYFDAPSVLERLCVNSISSDVATAWQAICETNIELQSIVSKLDEVITSNENKGQNVSESAMYHPLVSCF